jgi:uncharacterized MAPEG superfamily protein
MSLAYWCVLLAGLLPYLTVGLAKAWGRYDNSRPRDPESYKGVSLRAHSAHLNGFEAFPLFAIAVAVGSGFSAKASIGLLNEFAVLWIILRVAYIGAYVGNRPSLRSVLWSLGFFLTIAIFTMPSWHG